MCLFSYGKSIMQNHDTIIRFIKQDIRIGNNPENESDFLAKIAWQQLFLIERSDSQPNTKPCPRF